ncbi:MAG: DNA gyrase inhibitor YacG [Candidatus Acidiferrales bacterium]
MTHRCPICKKPTATQTHPEFPFCSERCRLHDLGNWASEKYTISEPAFDDSLFDDSMSRAPLDQHADRRDDHKDGRKN